MSLQRQSASDVRTLKNYIYAFFFSPLRLDIATALYCNEEVKTQKIARV